MGATLCPAQQRALEGLLQGLDRGSVLVLSGDSGTGKTTVLRQLHRSTGGAFLTIKPFLDAIRGHHPLSIEETFGQMVMEELDTHDVVIVDDLDLLSAAIMGCSSYPRSGFLNAPLGVLAAYAAEAEKKLLFGCAGMAPDAVHARCFYSTIGEFEPADYEFFCRAALGDSAERLDYAKIYRFAPRLNGHQLTGACRWLRPVEDLDTDRFIDYLRSQELTSNVDLSEVQAVALSDLQGIDDVIRNLEAHVILPLENDELAAELALKPKRGVLLVGPPGTGKTTIGRALAHRLKSKFFLVDGTFISGTGAFYGSIHWVFESAKQNAPSIIFIDDSDAIFQSGEELGLYRYLLTMLDGLESESAGRVCVMMTAMDVAHLPPALLRSGRIELWLEVRLPDAEARAEILRQHLSRLPPAIAEVELPRLVAATEGFTGADLKRLIEDGKNLLAYDKVRGLPLGTPTDYFLMAVDTVRSNKERYAAAEARARQQRAGNLPETNGYGDMDAEDDLP